MADCSSRWRRWRSPDIAESTWRWAVRRETTAARLFSEELGAVLQIRSADVATVNAVLDRHGLAALQAASSVP